MTSSEAVPSAGKPSTSLSPIDLAAQMLRDALQERSGGQADALAELPVSVLRASLVDDRAKLAFWLNVYNAGVRADLSRDPDRKERKYMFFARHGVVVAGKHLSFNQIEHGMLRRSKFGFTMGYLSNPLPNRFERNFRLQRRDPRIHFALNCGARSCPPIQVYEPSDADRQLDLATHAYLVDNSSFDAETRTVTAPRLLLWYRGDFGGRRGILELLARHGVIPHTDVLTMKFGGYDWTALASS